MPAGSPIKLGSASIPTTWTQLPGARPEKHSNDLDVLVRRYRVPTVPESVTLPDIGSTDREFHYPNMYLVDAVPTLIEGACTEVELTYMGLTTLASSGGLPANRSNPDLTESEVRNTSYNGKTSLSLKFQSQTLTTVKWYKQTTAPDINVEGLLLPSPALVDAAHCILFIFISTEGGFPPANFTAALAGYFNQAISITGQVEEVVSGRYWRATIRKQRVLYTKLA